MKVTKKHYGTLSNGDEAMLYTLDNGKMQVCVTDFGCTLTGIFLPDGKGNKDDVILGYSNLESFVKDPGYSFGSIVGRFANRIGSASFSIDGNTYQLDKNDNDVNTLHGGFTRYDHMVWNSKIISNKNGKGVEFSRTSPDGEQGFPGNVQFKVIYTLNDKNELRLEYKALSDKKTPVNLTNHAYFNLNGSGTVLNHSLKMNSEYILEVDDKLIPTGKLISVKGTAYDFNTEKTLGQDIEKVSPGYDNCYTTCWYTKDSQWLEPTEECFTAPGAEVAVLTSTEKNRTMKVYTNQPGIQLYAGIWIDGIVGKLGKIYERHGAVCLETQAFPDAPNKKDFPDCILEPGKEYDAITVYSFDF
ncbi:MAG: galactose mutarotase [Treponema sp.]|uniref:aldose epimerase family protein n=1 Tax=Treponema sp. TaxID=166 RepID=UPI00298DA9A6|nr:aldose epimerase family protein [Treponema sp.]MBR5933134.1 galactose mutarotase [Treponema sp.]